ncbi:hypothetical protein COY62_02790 [bacterium (Candidatus Howlettbacteria) CG_4_10_14_0_8_um_filter_40_9]|nr:MAG: hypothetical protein COY62_02790 [bacterium (Candidatus Howlettbacteria) CG_4_10_14_0_8_um_filter_40_9]
MAAKSGAKTADKTDSQNVTTFIRSKIKNDNKPIPEVIFSYVHLFDCSFFELIVGGKIRKSANSNYLLAVIS